MAWTLPSSFAVGEVLTAATMNKLRTSLSFLAGTASALVNTTGTTTSTSFTALGTAGPVVTLTTGTSAIVVLTALLYNTTANDGAYMGYAISGATTLAANIGTSLTTTSANALAMSAVFRQTGLTAGSNTFTAEYKVSASTGHFSQRNMIVIPLP